MAQNKLTIFLMNISLMILGTLIIIIAYILGFKTYFGMMYIVPTGALLIALGLFLILLSLFLFLYKDYWNAIKEIIFERILLKYHVFWILLIAFLVILFGCAIFSFELYNVLRSVPVLPIQIFEFFFTGNETWLNIYSLILRYSIGLWVTVYLWQFLIKKFLNAKNSKQITPTKNDNIQLNNTPAENAISQSEIDMQKQSPPIIIKLKRVLLNKFTILFLIAFLLRFLIYLNAAPGYDTGFYLFLAKDVVQENNLSIFFGNNLFIAQQNLALTALPTCIPLIGMTYLTGGDSLLAATIYIPILSVLVIYLCCKIVRRALNSNTLAYLVGIFLSFSVIQFSLINGLYKQLTTIFITLIIIYLVFFAKWDLTFKSIALICSLGLLVIIDLFYFLTIGVFFLILVNYSLFTRKFNWSILKDPTLFFILKCVFLSGLVVLSGSVTYLYFNASFSIPGLSIFYEFLLDITGPPNTGLFSMIYNNIYLLTPILLISAFALYGFICDFKKSKFQNKNFQLFLRISLIIFLILTLSEMFNLNFFYLDDRFLIFLEYVVVVYAAIGIMEIYDYLKSNYSNKVFFEKSKKVFMSIFLFCIVFSSILSIPYFRFGKLAPQEKEGMVWLLANGDTNKLTNSLRNDVVVVSNHHLEYWIQYYIHYNALNRQMYWTIGIILNVPVNQFISIANQTIYLLVSRLRAPSGELWNDADILNYLVQINTTLGKNYSLIYDNSMVYIYVIEVA